MPRLRQLLWPVGAGLLAGNLAAACSAIFLAKILGDLWDDWGQLRSLLLQELSVVNA